MSLENIVQQIDLEITNLTNARNAILGLTSTSTAPSNGSRKSRFTSTARARMAAAQKARWQKYRAAKGKTAAKTQSAKPVRVMSASARKRIAAAQKKRWAKVRAAKKAA